MKRTRQRQILSCTLCLSKHRKTKCDRNLPCASCILRDSVSACEYEKAPSSKRTTVSPTNSRNHAPQRHRDDGLLDGLDAAGAAYGPKKALYSGKVKEESILDDIEDVTTTIGLNFSPKSKPGLGLDHSTPNGDQAHSMRSWPDITARASNVSYQISSDPVRRARVIALLPSPEQIRALTDFYFDSDQVLYILLHETSFRTELEQFLTLDLAASGSTPDPAWLAILSAMLWLTSHFLLQESNQGTKARRLLGLDDSSLDKLITNLYQALQASLECANASSSPQFRILQALQIAISFERHMIQYTGPTPAGPGPGSSTLWFHMAVGIAKALRLHADPDLDDIDRMRDPALPTYLPLYSREIIRRSFHHLVYLDLFDCNISSVNKHKSLQLFPSGSYSTPPPSNYPEDSLISFKPPEYSEPLDSRTRFIWHAHFNQSFYLWSEIATWLNSSKGGQHDSLMRRYDERLKAGISELDRLRAHIDLQGMDVVPLFLVSCSYHHRLLRLHRPLMIESSNNSQWHESSVAAVSAARYITQTHRQLLKDHRNDLLVRNARYLYFFHVSALIVLTIHGLQLPKDREEMRIEIQASLKAFEIELNRLVGSSLWRGPIKAESLARELDKCLGELKTSPTVNILATLQMVHKKAALKEMERLETDPHVDRIDGSSANQSDWEVLINSRPLLDGFEDLMGAEYESDWTTCLGLF